jgi:hypothetical protein
VLCGAGSSVVQGIYAAQIGLCTVFQHVLSQSIYMFPLALSLYQLLALALKLFGWFCLVLSHLCRNRVQVSARSQLVPVARAAEIRSGSKGNLLRQLVSANVDAGEAGCLRNVTVQRCLCVMQAACFRPPGTMLIHSESTPGVL